MTARLWPLLAAALVLGACHRAPPPQSPTPTGPNRIPTPMDPTEPVIFEEGIASWYGRAFDGRPTASGEIFDSSALTAAHRRLPFGTLVRVVNVESGDEVVVRINDRGPHVSGRIIDVSRAAADSLGMVRAGTADVRLILVARRDDPARS
jgi:peptidoglycan lytic transglycosylase